MGLIQDQHSEFANILFSKTNFGQFVSMCDTMRQNKPLFDLMNENRTYNGENSKWVLDKVSFCFEIDVFLG